MLAMLCASLLASSVARLRTKSVGKVGILWHAANLEQEAVMSGPVVQSMRESNNLRIFRFWHFSDVPRHADDIRC